MDILPKFLYVFQTLPVAAPGEFFARLRTMISKFVWGGTRPRVRLTVLSGEKEQGGVGLPDFQLYHRAAVLLCIVAWFRHTSQKQWVRIEAAIAPLALTSLPWIERDQRGASVLAPFTEQVLECWDRVNRQAQVSNSPGPMTPVFDNPSFRPAMGASSFLGWRRQERTRLSQILSHNHTMPTRRELQERGGGARIDWYAYLQLQSWVGSFPDKSLLGRELTPFEDLLLQKEEPSRVLSRVASILRGTSDKSRPSYTRAWERELGEEFAEEEWRKCFILTHRLPRACVAQEKNYKIITRWYRYPVLLHRAYPSTSETCWRCGRERGTMVHIWWECTALGPFWQRIFELYNRLEGDSLPLTPAIGLLSMIPGSIKGAKQGILRFFLAAARSVIPRHWKSPDPPSIAEWVDEVHMLMRMEEMGAEMSDSGEKFRRTWTKWMMFRDGPDFPSWMCEVVD